jgi:hypothetical protein
MPDGSMALPRNVGEHPRRFGRGRTVYDPGHYVPVLAQRRAISQVTDSYWAAAGAYSIALHPTRAGWCSSGVGPDRRPGENGPEHGLLLLGRLGRYNISGHRVELEEVEAMLRRSSRLHGFRH